MLVTCLKSHFLTHHALKMGLNHTLDFVELSLRYILDHVESIVYI